MDMAALPLLELDVSVFDDDEQAASTKSAARATGILLFIGINLCLTL
jgi:hypothetical protein